LTDPLPPRADEATPDAESHPAPDSRPDAVPALAPASEAPVVATGRPLGLTRFTIEGRRAPGLFVVGWLALIVAGGLASIAFFGATGLAGSVLWFLTFVFSAVGLLLLGGSETVERRGLVSYRGPSPLVVLFAVIVITQLAGYALGVPLSAIGASIPRPVGDLIAVGVQALVFIGVVRLMVVGPGALSWREMGLTSGGAEAIRGLLGGAVFAGPVILVTAVIAALAVQLVGQAPPSPLPPTGTTSGLVLHLIAGAVIAPVAEEILFRGFALTAWRRLAGARAAIIRTSIVFVLAHVLFVSGDTFADTAALAFVGGVGRIPIAVALGFLFVRTGSLWGPIGLHAAFNGILIVIAELGTRA
jgi:membrane protease YdiL (CAAX protease family)